MLPPLGIMTTLMLPVNTQMYEGYVLGIQVLLKYKMGECGGLSN